MVDIPAVSQQVALGAVVEEGKPQVVQTVTMVAISPPQTRNGRVAQSVGLAATVEDNIPAVSQVQLLVAYKTGGTENLLNRSWSFVLDGHTFYAITLGEQGTFVYDQTTQQWAKWQTTGLSSWNMEIGTVWKGRVLGADQANPTIWEMDPDSAIDDEYKPITRVATGGYPVRGRDQPANYAYRITASVGAPEVPLTAPATIPTVQLTYSDNQGKTFQDAGTIDMPVGDFVKQLQWLSLGSMQQPGRIFNITDTGAMVRLDGSDADIEGQG